VASAVLGVLLVAAVLAVVVLPGATGGPRAPSGPAGLSIPRGISLDRSDNLYIADSGNNRVLRVASEDGSVTKVAGSGDTRPFSEGVLAIDTPIVAPRAVTPMSDGGFVILDQDERLLRVSGDGRLTRVPTNGPLRASLSPIRDLVADRAGLLYVATETRVVKLDPATGAMTEVAGSDTAGFFGDGGQATRARMNDVRGLALPHPREGEAESALVIADCGNKRVRRVDLLSGVITTLAGNGGRPYVEGGTPTEGGIPCPWAVTVGVADGNVYLADHGGVVRELASGVIRTVAGRPGGGGGRFTQDGRSQTETTFGELQGIAVDGKRRLYLSEPTRIRRVEEAGIVRTYA